MASVVSNLCVGLKQALAVWEGMRNWQSANMTRHLASLLKETKGIHGSDQVIQVKGSMDFLEVPRFTRSLCSVNTAFLHLRTHSLSKMKHFK